VKRELFLVAGAVELVLDFGIRAQFLHDLAGNDALCGDERGLGVLLGGCRLGGRRLALSPLRRYAS
jgi:hypothetical protein